MKCKIYKYLQNYLRFCLKKNPVFSEFFFTEFCCLSNKKFPNIENLTFPKIFLQTISLCKWRILKIISKNVEKLLFNEIISPKAGFFFLEFLIFKKKFCFKKNKRFKLKKKKKTFLVI